MRIKFSSGAAPKSGALVSFAAKGGKLLAAAAELDKLSKGALKRAISSSRFKGETGEVLEIVAPDGLNNSRVLLLGVGDSTKIKPTDLENLGGNAVARLNQAGDSEAAILGAGLDGAETLARVAFGARLRAYRFDKYKTKEAKDKKPTLKALSVVAPDSAKVKKAFDPWDKVAAGVFVSRDIISEPANIIYPKTFVAEAKKLEKLGLKIQVLGEKEMKKLGMGALLGVGQGSEQESQLLVMRWNGLPAARGKAAAPVAIVGKGVCFDTGGISLKPGAGMWDMKWDMGGAGVTLGLMAALAARKAKVNVVGVCGLVENMPDGKAQRPGDIVTSMSGQTIEVLNTDAEGRLVLADALWYTQETFKPSVVVDLATLTGAIMISLGLEKAGLFSNDDKLSQQLSDAGEAVAEPIWRLPLGPEYDKLIDSDIADIKNISTGRWGGSITAAQFLQRFIKNGTPWAHLDIAGVTWSEKDKPTVPKGATAFGVRLLNDWIAANHEKK